MGIEHLTFDGSYFVAGTAVAYGGYSNILDAPTRSVIEGNGAARAQQFLAKGFSLTGRDVLVLGCGPGVWIDHLRTTEGVNAWGLDSSTWAVANEVTGGYVLQGDATSETDLDAARSTAGVGPRWDAIVTELLLDVLSDADVQAAAPLWRDQSTTRPQIDWTGVIHFVSTKPRANLNPVTQVLDNPFNTHTLAEWTTLLDTGGANQDWVWRFYDAADAD